MIIKNLKKYFTFEVQVRAKSSFATSALALLFDLIAGVAYV